MSEKVTFGELIEAIAEETDNSKKFTHDFLKNFVDVINGGLEEDGKVNIAGFGKFKLRRVDEREGYNPQTDEKMTIPAHNKIVFKPYKDLRELVNAPYAHLEPALIEEDTAESDPTKAEESESDISPIDSADTKNQSDEEIPLAGMPKQIEPDQIKEQTDEENDEQDDFIPTAPPTSHSDSESEYDDSTVAGAENDASFELDIQDESNNQEEENHAEDEDDDIVEFSTGSKEDENDTEDDFLSDFISPIESSEDSGDSKDEETLPPTAQSDEEEEPDLTENTFDSEIEETEQNEMPSTTDKTEEEILAEEVKKLEDTVKDVKKHQTEEEPETELEQDLDSEIPAGENEDTTEQTSTPIHKQPRRKRNSALPYVAAAAIVLLLIAGGAWYYSILSDGTPSLTSVDQPTSTTNTSNQQNESQQSPAEDANENQEPEPTAEDQDQTTADNAQPSASEDASQQTGNTDAVEIEEGQTLWSLAEEKYGNPRLWPWIYGNNGSLSNPDLIYAGRSLSVPLPSGPQNNLNATDSVGVAKGFISTYQWYKKNEESKAKNHLWAAKLYHNNIEQLADIPIDKTDLSFANKAR